MGINQKEIMKTAASHLRKLSSEVQKFREKEEKRQVAEGLLKRSSFELNGEDLFEKMSELMDKDIEELKIIEKAIELQKTGEITLGEISTQVADNGELDPLTAFLIEDYQ